MRGSVDPVMGHLGTERIQGPQLEGGHAGERFVNLINQGPEKIRPVLMGPVQDIEGELAVVGARLDEGELVWFPQTFPCGTKLAGHDLPK